MRIPRSERVYPLTVVADRYTGVYSGGKYTAWNKHPDEIPSAPFEDDTIACYFWTEERGYPIGLGDTPNEAIADLVEKLDEVERLKATEAQ